MDIILVMILNLVVKEYHFIGLRRVKKAWLI